MTNYRLRKARCERCGTPFGHDERPLTRRQAEIYRYLESHVMVHGCAPTFAEIAEAFDYNSLATVHEHLTHLEEKGWIRRQYAERQAIECLVRTDDR